VNLPALDSNLAPGGCLRDIGTGGRTPPAAGKGAALPRLRPPSRQERDCSLASVCYVGQFAIAQTLRSDYNESKPKGASLESPEEMAC